MRTVRLFVLLLCIGWAACTSEDWIRGVDVGSQAKYKAAREIGEFICDDGHKTIHFDKVNDDYCDCEDGTDEPGTSACPNGAFFCLNRGYVGQTMSASKVNDGICDCCDGSDEWASSKCPNNCMEVGVEWRKEQLSAARAYVEGYKKRTSLATMAQATLQQKQSELDDLKIKNDEIQAEIDKLEAEKKVIEEEEDKERAHLQEIADAEAKAVAETADVEVPHVDDAADFVTANATVPEETPTPTPVAYTSEEGENIRKKISDIRSEHSTVNDEIRDHESILNIDFGDDKAFYSMKGECYEHETREYIYRVCPFDRAEQESKRGSATSLGKWGEWNSHEGNKYGKQKYENGEHCWNGPNRSATVTLTCGSESVLTDVDEPSKCTYTMVLSTPAACDEKHAKALDQDISASIES